MANIRDLKSEVNYLTYEIIADCNTYIYLNPGKRTETLKLIDEAVELRNHLIGKINKPESVTPQYFKGIREELIAGADAIFTKLRKLIK